MPTNKPRPSVFRRLHLPAKEREYFTQNLGLLLKSAVPVGEALESLGVSVKSRAFKKAISSMQKDIEAGYNVADTLERSGIIGSQTLALVRIGEASGSLIENLQIAAQQEEKRRIFASKVRSAMIYPSFVIVLTIIVGLGVAWFLLPRLADTFAQLQVELPPVSRVLINFGLFLKEHGIIAVPVAVAAVLLIGYILFVAPMTKNIGRRLLIRLPGVGRLIREVEIAQFGYLLGTLMEAGLSITQALLLLADTTSAPDYRKFYRHLARSLDEGFSFKESLAHYKKSSKLLSPAIQQIIIAGERSGSLPEVLKSIGKTYEQKSDTTTQNLETIIEPILLVVVAAGVMLVAIAVILPIYSLIGGLNQ
ncbi:MAG TPA: type II secretion system F family protein [Candidatus Saccharimonadales bacterium]|nr:type II secretion system F family protein [Candidatus Saccharimonadales bacterium]